MKIKVGNRIIATRNDSPYYRRGDIGVVFKIDRDGDPWVDFNHKGNPHVVGGGKWCVKENNLRCFLTDEDTGEVVA